MIQITSLAKDKIESFIEQRGGGLGIRIGVKTTGCNGLSYVLEYVDQQDDADEIHEDQGIKVFVNPKDLLYLNDITIDYKNEKFHEGFNFINPIESGRCGCGESFHI